MHYNERMDSLRKSTVRSQAWTADELRAGFMYYKELNGRFPTAHEIDAFPYLPTSRSIQRAYGGLVGLRKELFPDEVANFSIGEHRSGVAKATYAQGKDYEEQFYNYLLGYFEAIAVHEQKVIRPGNVNSDFYIYLSEKTGVVIDVFYANSIKNLIGVVAIKLKRYSLITDETYLVVVGNPELTQTMIDAKTANRRTSLPAHIKICSEAYFKSEVVPKLQTRSEFAR